MAIEDYTPKVWVYDEEVLAKDLNEIGAVLKEATGELAQIGQNYRPNLDKSAIAAIKSYPFEADFTSDGARIQFINVTLDVMTPFGPFTLDIPAGQLDFAHGQKICVDSGSRATEPIFIQADWPSINDSTVWAIGTMQQNGIVVDGKPVQRKVLSFFSGVSLIRDF